MADTLGYRFEAIVGAKQIAAFLQMDTNDFVLISLEGADLFPLPVSRRTWESAYASWREDRTVVGVGVYSVADKTPPFPLLLDAAQVEYVAIKPQPELSTITLKNKARLLVNWDDAHKTRKALP